MEYVYPSIRKADYMARLYDVQLIGLFLRFYSMTLTPHQLLAALPLLAIVYFRYCTYDGSFVHSNSHSMCI